MTRSELIGLLDRTLEAEEWSNAGVRREGWYVWARGLLSRLVAQKYAEKRR